MSHSANVIQFDALFSGVTTESWSNGKWPAQDSSLSWRKILSLEAHSVAFLQQLSSCSPDYDFTCKSCLFLKAQMETEAGELNKSQALRFTRDSCSWSKPALVLTQWMERWQFTKAEALLLKMCMGLFCTLFHARRSVDLGKSPKAQLSPFETSINSWGTEPAKIMHSNAAKCAR